MRLYVVTRQDLGPELQSSQCCYAVMQFSCGFPDVGRLWYEQPNDLSVRAVSNEAALRKLLNDARKLEIRAAPYFSAHMRMQLTAVALEESPKTKRLMSKLPAGLGPG